MVRKLTLCVALFLMWTSTAHTDWFPGDGHKMHFPQLPDEEGWNVNASNGQVLADDWMCSQSGPVDEIHFWGSWLNGTTGEIESFDIAIYTDIPDPDPTDPNTYSQPGDLLWNRTFPVGSWVERHITPDPQLWEGWYDPVTGDVRYPDHDNYYQYNIVGIPQPLIQEEGTIYWLAITANISPNTPGALWGWKSSIEHWNDDAVFPCVNTCVAPDNGNGTVDLPADCPYVTAPQTPFKIVDGLPVGSEIIMDGTFTNFQCNQPGICSQSFPVGTCEGPGGVLGGHLHCFSADLQLQVQGTGSLAGFNRFIILPVELEIHTGPRNPGDPVQSFPTEMVRLQGQLFGDPDFCQLQITGGGDFGFPSPGQMTLTQLGGGNWNVDSFFDIEYQIDFQGCPGSVLDGMGGSTQEVAHVDQGDCTWAEMFEPEADMTRTNTFWVEFDDTGTLTAGGGSDYYGQGWYFYPQDDWWNIWFYDHPYDDTRKKEIHIEFDAFPANSAAPSFIEVAVNWSTAQWSIDQPPADSAPPLPGEDENLYIGRATLLVGENFGGHYVYDFEIPDFNPEWVSIDVRGFNFRIPEGTIQHACLPQNPVSLDLSFVIDQTDAPDPIGACCFPSGFCLETTADSCIAQGGTYQGDGTSCTPNPCPEPTGACCFDDGTCADLSFGDCIAAGGTYQGDGVPCTPNPCPQPATGACCDPASGFCFQTTEAACTAQGFTYQGDGSLCLGDANGNGLDDACEEPEGRKWFQPPDLSDLGMDVLDVFPRDILADDFLCTETGRISEVHVFGSWLGDEFPFNDPCSPIFELRLYSDIPATPSGPVLPAPCPWVPAHPLVATVGIPDGTLQFDSFFDVFTCDNSSDRCVGQLPPGECEGEGGVFNGNFQCFDGMWNVVVTGTGSLAGFQRTLQIPAHFEVHTESTAGIDDTRTVQTEMISMSLTGLRADPDFEFLQLRAGSGEGLPTSPGQMTLTRLPSGDFNVDSFFDIDYRIDFQGAPGGALDGMAGTTEGSVRMESDGPPTGGGCTTPDKNPNGFSRPGDLLCTVMFDPGTYECRLYADSLNEGWMDPTQPFYTPNGDTQCWEYIFKMDQATSDCFEQFGTPDQPIVYWLAVQAHLPDDVWSFGWKSSTQHWNDDAVWALVQGPPANPWNEMRYVAPHPYQERSVDLAFSIFGPTSCCVIMGDIDNNGAGPDIADLVYLVAYMFNGGPPPPCMAATDVNGDGSPVPDIADLVYLVAYMFQGGPPPVPCP